MAILQFRLRATWPNGDSEIKGVYDTLESANRRKAEWEVCCNAWGNTTGIQFLVEPNP